MRVFLSCFLLGTIVPSYAQEAEATCEDAASFEECFGLELNGLDCVWDSLRRSQTCVNRAYVDASIYGWSWDGRPEAPSEGTKKTISRASGITHFNDFHTHNWERTAEYGDFQTYIRSGADGRPTAIGLSIPSDLDKVFPKDESRDPGARFSLPKGKHHCTKAIPFDHVMLNYAANGHPGGYQMVQLLRAFAEGSDAVDMVVSTSSFYQRHFDVDFHLDTPEESNNIKCSKGVFPACIGTQEEYEMFENIPASEYIPASFMFDPISKIPFKGSHWQPAGGVSETRVRDEYAPNFGTYDGRVVLWEAMVSGTSLKNLAMGDQREWDYEVPEKVQTTGYYPRKIVIRKAFREGLSSDAQRVFQIELSDMVFRIGDDAFKENGQPKRHMVEDVMCPAIDCKNMESPEADKDTVEFCSTCGTIGVRAVGKRHKGTKQVTVETSCDCSKYCQEAGAEGFKFVQHTPKSNKSGKCTCLTKISSSKKFDLRHTSGVF